MTSLTNEVFVEVTAIVHVDHGDYAKQSSVCVTDLVAQKELLAANEVIQ